jgi:hypothetical protein
MVAEVQFKDIIFGIFFEVGGEMTCMYGYWAKMEGSLNLFLLRHFINLVNG